MMGQRDLDRFLEIIKHQRPDMVESENWEDCRNPEIRSGQTAVHHTVVVLNAVQVGFSFDENGRFIGIFNWKE